MIDPDLLRRALGQHGPLSERSDGRLNQFAALVQKWNPSINLVSRSALADLWHRHILDSIQLFGCAEPKHRLWLDIGSGGGFPGIVIAILAAEVLPELRVVLVESDKRKAVFLAEVVRQLGLTVVVHAARVEDLVKQKACVVSARALAPLPVLCGLAYGQLADDGICGFLKGASVEAEIQEARKSWRFDLDQVPSVTDSRSSVLFLRGLRHV